MSKWKKWEYKIATFADGLIAEITAKEDDETHEVPSPKRVVGYFNSIGLDGWEAVSCTILPSRAIQYLFKRPLEGREE